MFNLGSTVILLISDISSSWSENIVKKEKILIRDEILRISSVFTLETYSFDLVSIFIISFSFTNKGTWIIAPVSKVAGFVALEVVSPFKPGSRHSSYTKNGCLILVFMRALNKSINI